VLATFSPSFDSEGRVEGAQAMLRDVTELVQTRAALKRSESRFRDLVENAHDLVWTVDRQGNWLYLNQAARQIYGRDAAELLGRPFAEVVHPDHRDKDMEMFRSVLRGHQVAQHETIHLHQDGGLRYLSFNVRPYLDDNWEIVGAMGMARDITEQKLYQHRLEHLADHDVLTGLHNRHYFENEVARALGRVARGGPPDGLLYIDVDNFKYVNDTLGHAAGDRLLLEIAQSLLARLRQGDVLARFGGDEFTVLLQGASTTLLPQIAQSFHNLFKGFTFLQDGQVFDVRVSVGAMLITAQTASVGEALAQADLACTLAKSRGRNQAHVYDVADRALASMVSDVSWTRKINEALEHGRFVLHYQPVVRLRDSAISHYEVLLRMREPDGELIAPGLFLPAAERFGLIHGIDRWVVERSVRELGEHQRAGRDVAFAVNLSARVLDDREFLPFLRAAITEAALDPQHLTFEFTETAAIAHMASAREFIEHLKQLGCRAALDDFGSGFSSYSYLKHLPVDYLKIDGGFIKQLARDSQDQAIVQSMNQVAHALGKETIAEFVEDDASLALLRRYGVDYAQGYYLGRPADGLHGP
jgi:diguanylate cyclase (GGDEF)-like protein/PAS domain S-box-containing protein